VKKRKILFVDDSADIRRAMGRILELEGFDVVEAEDAPSAIGMLGIVPAARRGPTRPGSRRAIASGAAPRTRA
jgi:hypothetical protein